MTSKYDGMQVDITDRLIEVARRGDMTVSERYAVETLIQERNWLAHFTLVVSVIVTSLCTEDADDEIYDRRPLLNGWLPSASAARGE